MLIEIIIICFIYTYLFMNDNWPRYNVYDLTNVMFYVLFSSLLLSSFLPSLPCAAAARTVYNVYLFQFQLWMFGSVAPCFSFIKIQCP